MHATAQADWDIGGRGSGGYEISYEVVEAVEEVHEDGATVAVSMTPVEISAASGAPAPGPEDRTFKLEVGTGGEVLQIIEVDGVAAEDLDPNDLAFIGTYRPPLPLEPVGLRDTWLSEQRVEVGTVFQEIENLGRLQGLDVVGQSSIATLGYEGEGPIVWTTSLPQGQAELRGAATTASSADLDIETGTLMGADSRTSGDFEVTVLGSDGEAPITGTLHLELTLDLERI